MTKFRLNRRYFWIALLLTVALTVLLAPVHPAMVNGGFFLPWVVVHAGRLRDLGLRGIWAVGVLSAALLVLIILAFVAEASKTYPIWVALPVALGLVSFSICLGVLRGKAGDNAFGPAPRGWRLGAA